MQRDPALQWRISGVRKETKEADSHGPLLGFTKIIVHQALRRRLSEPLKGVNLA